MIHQLIDAMDLAARTQLPAVVRHGLSELRPVTGGTAPHIYDGGSTWQAVAGDRGGSWSYWRLTAPVVEVDTDGPSCNDYFQVTYQVRLVTMVDRELCGAVQDAARGAASAIRGTDDDIRSALKLSRFGVDRVSIDLDSAKVYQGEFGQAGDVPPGKALVALDVSLTAVGKAHCFAPCEPVGSLLCLAIERATWQAIKACMSSTQLQVAEEDLCEPVAPCDPLTVTINGEEVEVVDDPCGAIARITVTQGGTEVGSLVEGVWVVPECPPCEDLNYSLVNTEALELESGSVTDPCGATLNLVAPDATITFDGLEILSAPSGATSNLDCGTNIESAHVTLGGSAENGIYYISGTAGGKTRYQKNATHAFEYSGTRWVLIRPGSDHQAALGNETYPWLADWTGTGIAVDEGTIGQYCGGNVEPCADLTIAINGTTYGTVADPCGATAAVNVHDSNGNDVGSLVSGSWVVAPPANVLHEYTTGGTWSKPTSPSFKGVWVFAAGGGGAGGAGGVSGTVYGGGGGGGGAIVRLWIPAASLGLTETYAIGAGAVSVATGAGGAGGATLFGAHVDAKGGGGGNPGAASPNPAQVAGGSALLCVPSGTGASISGAPGGRGRREPGAFPLAGSAVIASVLTLGGGSTTSPIASGAAGGGAGGGWSTSTGTGTAGGDGGGCYQGGSLTTGGAGGAVGGSAGTAGVGDIYLDPFLGIVTTSIGLGTGGGGGGGASGATAGGTGAAGGRAAGGGGGGSTQSGTRGASGAGGNGFLLVYEVFAI